MGKNILRCLSLVVTVAAALFLSGCGNDSKEQERLRKETEYMVNEAYEAQDYPRIIALVDSLKQQGSIAEGNACYWLGIEHCEFLDVKEANAPIGLWPDLEYVGEEMDLPSDSMMLLYTDGLNEAENRQQEQYGDDRIVELLTSLSASSCRDMVEALKTDTDRFRDGAEPNDDLTMLAVHVSKS